MNQPASSICQIIPPKTAEDPEKSDFDELTKMTQGSLPSALGDWTYKKIERCCRIVDISLQTPTFQKSR